MQNLILYMALLTITKNDVYVEVAKTTSYTGLKMDGDSYERIFTTDEDQTLLDRFWEEGKSIVCNSLKRFLSSEEEAGEVFKLTLDLSKSFDDNQLDSMQQSLFSFFVMSITSKWYVFTNKPDAAEYSVSATSYLDDIIRKAYFKKKPTRPTYN